MLDYFLSGGSKPKSVVGNYQRALSTVFEDAKIPFHGFSHTSSDTPASSSIRYLLDAQAAPALYFLPGCLCLRRAIHENARNLKDLYFRQFGKQRAFYSLELELGAHASWKEDESRLRCF
jgi:hypothetical protein